MIRADTLHSTLNVESVYRVGHRYRPDLIAVSTLIAECSVIVYTPFYSTNRRLSIAQ